MKNMKLFSYIFILISGIVFLLLIGFGINQALTIQNDNQLTNQRLYLPKAARFTPRNAAFTLHILTNPNNLSKYTKPKRIFNRLIQQQQRPINALLNGSFALANLNFNTDLSQWIGEEVSLIFLEPRNAKKNVEWVLALESKEKYGAKQFLQNFWDEENKLLHDVKVSNYRGIGIISSKEKNKNNNEVNLSLALVDDNFLLLSSKLDSLKEVLDTSQVNKKYQKSDERLESIVKDLDTGIAILTVSPSVLDSWLELPPEFVQREDLNGLVASVKLKDSAITLDGIFDFNGFMNQNSIPENGEVLNSSQLDGLEDSFAFINKTIDSSSQENFDPILQLINPIIKKEIMSINQESTRDIVKALTHGSFVFLNEPSGWLIGTAKNDEKTTEVNQRLTAMGFSQSILESNNQVFNVWSSVSRKKSDKNQSIDTDVAIILEQDGEFSWWSKDLIPLENRIENERLSLLLDNSDETSSLKKSNFSQQIALGPKRIKQVLKKWLPWQLLKTITGDSIESNIKTLVINIGAIKQLENSQIILQAQVSMN